MNRLGSAQAKDYGHSVVEVGFDGLGVNPEHYVPQVGDIAIFPEVPDHPAGHIQYYTSNGWVSDTVQKHFYREVHTKMLLLSILGISNLQTIPVGVINKIIRRKI